MRSAWKTLAAVAALSVFVTAQALYAQRGPEMGRGMPMYDPATITTVHGTVRHVRQSTMGPGHPGGMRRGPHMGTHLILDTRDGTYTVMVGPTRYVENRGFRFHRGDRITVTGSRVSFDGGEALIAREIRKGRHVLTLRDQRGVPRWSMGRGWH